MSTTSFHLCACKDPDRVERLLDSALARSGGITPGCRLGKRSVIAARFREAFAEWIVAASFAGDELAETIIDPRPRTDRGHDVIVRGYRIMAVFGRDPGGSLIIPDPYSFRSDFAALVLPPQGFSRITIEAGDDFASEKFTVPEFAAMVGGIARSEVFRRQYRHEATGGLWWPRRKLWKLDRSVDSPPFHRDETRWIAARDPAREEPTR